MPYIVRQCVEEVEKRGIEEVGIYRISGVATDIQALKAVFDASESGRPSRGGCRLVGWMGELGRTRSLPGEKPWSASESLWQVLFLHFLM